jgi:hypothetical protein
MVLVKRRIRRRKAFVNESGTGGKLRGLLQSTAGSVFVKLPGLFVFAYLAIADGKLFAKLQVF